MEANALEMLIVPACQAVAMGLAGGYAINSLVHAFDSFFGFVSYAPGPRVDPAPTKQEGDL